MVSSAVLELEPFVWLLYFSGGIAFLLACGIGANDVSNTFGSAVGAGSLTLKQAIVIACVFELLGSVLLGAKVSTLIKEKLISGDAFEGEHTTLLLVLVAALITAAVWLLLATLWRLPVSTTHTVVGSVIGSGLTAKGFAAIQWNTVAIILVAWFLSPVVTGAFAHMNFRFLRWSILRKDAATSLRRVHRLIPALAFLIAAVNVFGIMLKATGPMTAVATALSVGAIAAFLPQLLTNLLATMPKWKSVATFNLDLELSPPSCVGGALDANPNKNATFLDTTDIFQQAMSADAHAAKMHEDAEVFGADTESALSAVQVMTAMFNSFTHGSNDVSNSVGLFSAVVSLFASGTIVTEEPISVWILAVGGAGISIGLVLFGHRLIATLGVRLTKITPSRGIVIDLTSAFVVMVASHCGISISSTQCVVGATVGIGMAQEQGSGVNWRLVLRTMIGWLGTLLISACTSAAIFAALAFFTPTLK